VADPAAGIVGRRLGRIRLRARRSLEGTLAFLAAGTLAALASLTVFHAIPWPERLMVALVGAAAGALAELFTTRLDDNLTIPLTVAGAAAATELALRVV
jgi:dolichol kinase